MAPFSPVGNQHHFYPNEYHYTLWCFPITILSLDHCRYLARSGAETSVNVKVIMILPIERIKKKRNESHLVTQKEVSIAPSQWGMRDSIEGGVSLRKVIWISSSVYPARQCTFFLLVANTLAYTENTLKQNISNTGVAWSMGADSMPAINAW